MLLNEETVSPGTGATLLTIGAAETGSPAIE
jgi:hypothetical protein